MKNFENFYIFYIIITLSYVLYQRLIIISNLKLYGHATVIRNKTINKYQVITYDKKKTVYKF